MSTHLTDEQKAERAINALYRVHGELCQSVATPHAKAQADALLLAIECLPAASATRLYDIVMDAT